MKDVPVSEALALLAEVSGNRALDLELRFGSLGLDSLQSIEWLTLLEDELGVEFDLRALDFYAFVERSIGDVIAVLYEQAAASPAA